jgi:hypothetical protein
MMTNKWMAIGTFCLITSACGAADAPSDAAGGGDATATEVQAPSDVVRDDVSDVPSETGGLALDESSERALKGEYSADGETLRFDISKEADRHVTVIYGSEGELLLRATIDGEGEQLAFGEAFSMQGPAGAIFGRMEPRWEDVETTGDVANAGALFQRPDFALIWKLVPALANEPRVDGAIMPPVLIPATDEQPSAAGAPWTHEYVTKSHDPVGCGFCHAGCAAATAACVVATWGIFAWLCAAPGVACHAACADGPCS